MSAVSARISRLSGEYLARWNRQRPKSPCSNRAESLLISGSKVRVLLRHQRLVGHVPTYGSLSRSARMGSIFECERGCRGLKAHQMRVRL